MNAYTHGKIKRTPATGLGEHPQYHHPKQPKHRVLNDANNRRVDPELKSITRKSIEVNLAYNQKAPAINSLYPPSQPTKPHYRRVNHNFRKGHTRYEEDEKDNTRISTKSPYLRAPNSRNEQAQPR